MNCYPVVLHILYIHWCLFSLTSVALPVPDGRQRTSTSLLCFLWKAGVKLSPPSCFHQCVVLREFPISLTVRVGFTRRDDKLGGGLAVKVHFPEPSASPRPSGSDIIPQSLRGTLSQGLGFLGSLIYTKRVWGPLT